MKQSHKAALPALALSVSMVAGCTIPLKSPPQISYDDDAQPAVQLADPPRPVEIVEMPKLLPLPAASLLISPFVDLAVTGASYDANRDKDPFFNREVVQGLVSGFLAGAADPSDPRVNPLHADLTGLGPVYIQAGEDEALVDDARLLDEAARKAWVEVRLDVFPGMLHTFQMAAGRAPEADDAIRRLAGWVRPRLGL